VRPEHFEDAALIGGYDRIRALTFSVQVELVESLGADKYVYFSLGGDTAQAEQLAELAAEAGAVSGRYVARVSTESAAAAGQTIELALDTAKVAVFDADSGANLTIPAARA
jgi:multiple sugar transport system ATP-binding protein